MSPWLIYWIGTADKVEGVATGIFVPLSAVFMVAGIAAVVLGTDVHSNCPAVLSGFLKKYRKLVALAALVWVLSGAVAALCPSSRTLAAMYMVPAILAGEEPEYGGGEIYKLAVEFVGGKLAVESKEEKL